MDERDDIIASFKDPISIRAAIDQLQKFEADDDAQLQEIAAKPGMTTKSGRPRRAAYASLHKSHAFQRREQAREAYELGLRTAYLLADSDEVCTMIEAALVKDMARNVSFLETPDASVRRKTVDYLKSLCQRPRTSFHYNMPEALGPAVQVTPEGKLEITDYGRVVLKYEERKARAAAPRRMAACSTEWPTCPAFHAPKPANPEAKS